MKTRRLTWKQRAELAEAELASALFIIRAADRLAVAVSNRVRLGHLDARSEPADALLDYDSLDDHRAAVGLPPSTFITPA